MIAGACFRRGSGPPHPHAVSWQPVFLVRGAFRRLRAGGRRCIASQYDANFFLILLCIKGAHRLEPADNVPAFTGSSLLGLLLT